MKIAVLKVNCNHFALFWLHYNLYSFCVLTFFNETFINCKQKIRAGASQKKENINYETLTRQNNNIENENDECKNGEKFDKLIS